MTILIGRKKTSLKGTCLFLWSDAGMRWARARGMPGLLEVNAPLIVEQRTHRTLWRLEPIKADHRGCPDDSCDVG